MIMLIRKSTENLFLCSEKELRKMLSSIIDVYKEKLKQKNTSIPDNTLITYSLQEHELELIEDDVIGDMMQEMHLEMSETD